MVVQTVSLMVGLKVDLKEYWMVVYSVEMSVDLKVVLKADLMVVLKEAM